jgi:hypothetical protein
MYRPTRFVSQVRVVTTNDVNIEELAQKELSPSDAMGVSDGEGGAPTVS